ncbi:MAG: hypothetical protein INR67_10260 [Jatrophihabitans endophyticus]|nr:hypothetical protein [Jatrophihabitans endophyticus]
MTGESADGGSSACRQTFTITNHGWLSEQVEGQRLDSDVPGARIIRPLPRIIPSGGHRSLSIALGARWCRAFDRVETPEAQARLDEPTLMLTLHRPWGTISDAVELREPIAHDGFSINW